ncbi:MAG: hypothetical protein BM564_13365 [Bacteroidetes bacterium MedPE-SWsnd-G2]|nr:MAG: hypothetical protein BM564_13365 [Bacteroidetes bacterium MedPE-SWsnd-G2]
MAFFLNRDKLNVWIPKLIKEAEKEVVIIVPYIKLSNRILDALNVANDKNIQITIVYREDKIDLAEKNKLLSFGNLNLLHHPNIHCKCFYNGDLLIIGSMNLYAYSEENNREMGTLFSRNGIEFYENEYNKYGQLISDHDRKRVFDDAVFEVNEIINGATSEKLNHNNDKEHFSIDIIKTDEEKEIDYCAEINKYFENKKFKPINIRGNVWYSICRNYFDNLDVLFENKRVTLKFNIDDNKIRMIYDKWMQSYDEFEYEWFKYYWKYKGAEIYIYLNRDYDWESLSDEECYNKFRDVLSKMIDRYRVYF